MFDHLFAEMSVAAGIALPRYQLWLELNDRGWTPDELTPGEAILFIDRDLESFLGQRGLWITPRDLHRLRKRVMKFDPSLPTPSERLEAWDRGR